MSNLRTKPGCPAKRYTATATGTFTVTHGLSFGTAAGTVDMYEVRIATGSGYAVNRNVDAYTLVVTVAPCIAEVWPLGYPDIMGH